MGGERETTIRQQKPGTSGQISNIRFHENRTEGTIHFHDDAAGLKVAVPAKTWFRAWEQLTVDAFDTWRYFDVKNSTVLHVSLSQKGNEVDCTLHIESVKLSDSFASLEKFTRGS